MQLVNHSEVKFAGVWIPVSVREWGTNLYVGKYGSSIDWPIPNVQSPSHSQSLRQSLCGRVGEHQIVCGDWLVCQTTSVCNNSITCRLEFCLVHFVRTYAPMYNLDGHFELGTIWSMDPSRLCLPAEPAFGNARCGRSHGDQHKTASPHALNLLMTNVWL